VGSEPYLNSYSNSTEYPRCHGVSGGGSAGLM